MSEPVPAWISMTCANAECEAEGTTVAVKHSPEQRRRGWAFVTPDPPPTCALCGSELTYN